MTDTTDWKAEAERLRAERDHASALFESMASRHAKLAAWARETLPEELQAQFFGVLANGAPDWRTAPRNLAVDLLAMTAERDAALAELAQAREVLRALDHTEGRCPLCGYRGHAPDCALSAALAAKGE